MCVHVRLCRFGVPPAPLPPFLEEVVAGGYTGHPGDCEPRDCENQVCVKPVAVARAVGSAMSAYFSSFLRNGCGEESQTSFFGGCTTECVCRKRRRETKKLGKANVLKERLLRAWSL